MTAPALTLVPVLIDGTGTRANARTATLQSDLLDRAARDDYHHWLSTAAAAGGCVRPIRLRGTVHDVDAATGEILSTFDTGAMPDRVIYTCCGDRRASVCPPCAETYRRDTYQLVRAGLAGGKGVPESVAVHPCVFATLTAPSFGPVHTRPMSKGGKVAQCRPRRKASYCAHGRRLSCPQRHKDTDACLGKPLCPDCYDYDAAVVWNAHAPELWRRTTVTLRRRLGRLAKEHGVRVWLSYAKVAEFQARGVVHFHAIIRLDGHDPADPGRVIRPAVITAAQLAAVITDAARATWFATVPHPARPRGWDITWGTQTDTRIVKVTAAGEITDVAVASYLAKYATKTTEAVGIIPVRISDGNLKIYGSPHSHQGRLISAAWRLGHHRHPDFEALRRWAHMLGYRGHFSTKSRRYSTTLRALRTARADWQRRRHRTAEQLHLEETTTVIAVTDLAWAGRGWRTTADAFLALSAAARAREQDRIAREEMANVS
jgi:hypothetical protein